MTYAAARADTLAPHPVVAAMNAMRYDAAALGAGGAAFDEELAKDRKMVVESVEIAVEALRMVRQSGAGFLHGR